MSSSDIVRKAIVDTAKSMMQKRWVTKISVRDITDTLNISRSSFYYYFNDKFDLVNWIFSSEASSQVSSISDPGKLHIGYANLCKYLYENRLFYLNAFKYLGQNSLSDYLLDFYSRLCENRIKELSKSSQLNLDSTELFILSRLEAHSYVGMIMDWVKSGMKDDYLQYFDKLKKIPSDYRIN